MNEETLASWEKFLSPDTLKQNLVAASVFLTAYELLRDSLTRHLRGFFLDPGTVPIEELLNPGISDSYRTNVLSLDRREMVACAMWFRNSGALEDSDLTLMQTVTDHRNVIAHELPKLILDASYSVNLQHLEEICGLIHKVDNWWIREVEIPTNPDFDEQEIEQSDLDAAFSFKTLMLSFLVQIANGDDAGLRAVFEAWHVGITELETHRLSSTEGISSSDPKAP